MQSARTDTGENAPRKRYYWEKLFYDVTLYIWDQ